MDLGNKLVLGALVISLLFIMVGHIFRDKIQAVLKQPLYKLEKKIVFDWWSVSHLLLWSFIGFIKPGNSMVAFLFGVGFEIFEDSMASDKNTQSVNCPNKNALGGLMCNGKPDGYWYGKVDDVFSNMVGYMIGETVRTKFYPYLII